MLLPLIIHLYEITTIIYICYIFLQRADIQEKQDFRAYIGVRSEMTLDTGQAFWGCSMSNRMVPCIYISGYCMNKKIIWLEGTM